MGPPTDPPNWFRRNGRFQLRRDVEIGARVQLLIPEILEQAAVELIGSGLGHDIHHAAQGLPVLG